MSDFKLVAADERHQNYFLNSFLKEYRFSKEGRAFTNTQYYSYFEKLMIKTLEESRNFAIEKEGNIAAWFSYKDDTLNYVHIRRQFKDKISYEDVMKYVTKEFKCCSYNFKGNKEISFNPSSRI